LFLTLSAGLMLQCGEAIEAVAAVVVVVVTEAALPTAVVGLSFPLLAPVKTRP
jgi:hypothetical protein